MKPIACSKYSEFDDLIITKASDMGLPLIGGTALEILSDYYKQPNVRSRSENDLDFITNSYDVYVSLNNWLYNNVDTTKVQVDIMHIISHNIPKELIIDIRGIKVMSPEYLIWSKVQRFTEKDKSDILWLLQIADIDLLEVWMERLGVTTTEIDKINDLIK